MKATTLFIPSVISVLALAMLRPVRAADLLVPNYSFEEGLAHWSPVAGSDGISVDADHRHSGEKSVKIVARSSARATALESGSVACTPGVPYSAFAWACIESGAAELSLRFYDRSNALLGSERVSAQSPRGEWAFVKVQGTAPVGAVSFRISLGSGGTYPGTVYWDDVLVTPRGTVTDLGPQVFGAATHAAAFGKGPAGEDRIYLIQDGAADEGVTPGILHVIDANSLAVVSSHSLGGSQGGWGIVVASDRTVYAGVYATGHVFQLKADGAAVVDLGAAIPGETFLYGMSAGADGEVYGGTFPHAQVFKFTPGSGFSVVGPTPFHQGSTYVRSTAYDAVNRVLYVGAGVAATLLRHDPASGKSVDVLPSQFAKDEFTYGTRVCGSKVLTHLLSSSEGVVLEVDPSGNARLESVFPMGSTEFTPADKGVVYYTRDRLVSSYELATKKTAVLGLAWQGNAYAMTVMELADQRRFPGKSVVGVSCLAGQIWVNKTDVTSGYTTSAPLSVTPMRQTIESVVCGPDNKIYSSGYLTGGTGIYTPMSSHPMSPTRRGVEQCEGMTTLGRKIYFGGYPQAYLYEFDPFSPWVVGSNPRVLFNLALEKQDRPFGMTSDGVGRVFMGTLATYGALGGTLTEYNAANGSHVVHPHDTIGIPDLSLIALTYADGTIYGGTTVSGGLGAAPSQSAAKLLKYTVATGTGVGIALPTSIPNQRAITGVTVGPDHKIWMMVEGWLVIYNPATGTFDYQANLFPSVVYEPTASSVFARDATLITAEDGWVYGTIQGRILFKLQPATKAMTVITATEGGSGLTKDAYGNLYFYSGTNLRRYAF